MLTIHNSILLSRLLSPAHSLHSFHLVYHLFMTGSAIMAFLSIAASQNLYCLDLVNERAVRSFPVVTEPTIAGSIIPISDSIKVLGVI